MAARCRFWIGQCLIATVAFAQQYSITTFAGADPVGEGRQATTVPLGHPTSVFGDRAGNLFVSDYFDDRLLKIDARGTARMLAGNWIAGYSGDGGPAINAAIAGVRSIVVDSTGNIYFADSDNHRIRKIDTNGRISTLADPQKLFPGSGLITAADGSPRAVAVDASGNVYTAAEWVQIETTATGIVVGAYSRVYMITPSGTVTSIAGGIGGYAGDGGPAAQARVTSIHSIAVDATGNIYLGDIFANKIRRIGADGNISLFAGTGSSAFAGEGGPALQASLQPSGLAVDSAGNLYVADRLNSRVMKIDVKTGSLTTIAGTGRYGYSGDDGPAKSAQLAAPASVWVDAVGDVFIADTENGRIRRVTADGTIRTVAGAAIGDGGPAVNAFLSYPQGVAADNTGAVYIADDGHHRVRRVAATGEISTVAGDGYSGYADGGGRGTLARVGTLYGLAVSPTGDLYFADSGNYRVRKVSRDGLISDVAGTGRRGFSGDGGAATAAQIGAVTSIAFDAAGNLYFTDTTNNRIRKVTPQGTISTFAGNGTRTAAGDGGQAASAQLMPNDICVDQRGNMYVADSTNHRIRKIDSAGVITTIAGTGVEGTQGDGGPATSAQLSSPGAVAVDAGGNVFVADRGSHLVRRITAAGVISTIAGKAGNRYFSGDRTLATSVSLDPYRVAVDGRGGILVADWVNFRVRRLTANIPASSAVVSGDGQTVTVREKAPGLLTVRVVDAAGVPVAGVAVVFAVSTGSASLSSARETTAADGTAGTAVTMGDTPGEVVVTATIAGLAPITFKLTAKASVPTPRITSGGVMGASRSDPPVQSLAPNGLAIVWGENFAAQGVARMAAGEDLVAGAYPTKLAGTCVFVAEKPAVLLELRPDEIRFVAPALESSGTVDVRVAVNCGTPDEVRSIAEPVPYQAAAPEFVYAGKTGEGKRIIKAVNAAGENIGAAGLVPDVSFVSAKPGEVLKLFAFGLGMTDPALVVGTPPAEGAPLSGTWEIVIGGFVLTTADMKFAGVAAGGSIGEYVVEIRLPDDIADGEIPVVMTVAGFSSPAGYIVVQR